MREEYMRRIEQLCSDIRRDVNLFLECVICALKEERTHFLTPQEENLNELKQKKEAKGLFLNQIQKATGRKWDLHEFDCLWNTVRRAYEKPLRETLKFEEKIRFYWNSKEECAECHRKPSDVILHIHHKIPVKHWGASVFENLKFLCVDCHRRLHKKGNKPPIEIVMRGC